MKKRISFPGFSSAVLLALCLGAGCLGSLDHRERAFVAPEGPGFSNWEEVFSQPSPIRLTALVTGWVEADASILIDVDDERVPDSRRGRLWVPSIAYLVEHPKGRLLLDAGVRAGECAYGLRPIYWVECRNREGSDALSQLEALGLRANDLDHIFVSHFHGDHASGLEALTAAGDVPILVARAELAAIASATHVLAGYRRHLIPAKLIADTVDDALLDMPIVGQALDYFGDGSLWLIPTPGHTEGHLSALVNAAPHPLLLTFDASHLMAGFDLGIAPGAVAGEESALESLEELRRFAAEHPRIRVLAGHEPDQWKEDVLRVVLIENAVAPPPRP